MEATPCPIRLVFAFTLYWLTVLSLSCNRINPRTYTQIHTPTVVQAEGGGGEGVKWMETLPGVFGMLQYFEMILPLVESL